MLVKAMPPAMLIYAIATTSRRDNIPAVQSIDVTLTPVTKVIYNASAAIPTTRRLPAIVALKAFVLLPPARIANSSKVAQL